MTETSTPNEQIVVGVDGSSLSVDALRWAARICAATGAEIQAVTCWDYPANYGFGGIPADWSPKADAGQILATALKDAFGDQLPAGLRQDVYQGHPARVLIDAAEHAQMLVLGSRGHGGFVGLLLGSVSAACAEMAACPVLVVHSKTTPSS